MFQRLKNLIKKDDFQSVAKKELKANKVAIESLRDYDQGKKDISTANVRKHLPSIRTTP